MIMVVLVMIVAVVIVIVVVRVGRDHACRGRPEELGELRVLLDLGGASLAADMAVEADDVIALRHHHMEIVADHEDAAAVLLPDLAC